MANHSLTTQCAHCAQHVPIMCTGADFSKESVANSILTRKMIESQIHNRADYMYTQLNRIFYKGHRDISGGQIHECQVDVHQL